MRVSVTALGRSLTIEATGLSTLYIETGGHEFVYDRRQWFELPGGRFRHWLLEKKRAYRGSMSETLTAA